MVIKSVGESNHEILDSIRTLYCPEGFEVDASFGNGQFYKNLDRPKLCFDIEPLFEFVTKSCSTELPLDSNSVNNIVFDPPFLTYVKGARSYRNGNVVMSKKFGGYWAYSDLEDHYQKSITEFSRVLRKNGKLIFKCQDIVHNHVLRPTHLSVVNWGNDVGLKLKDLFILTAKHRMPSPQKGIQRHARIFHSYFVILNKS